MIDPSLVSFFYSDCTYSNTCLNYKNLLGINNLSISNSVSFEDPSLLGSNLLSIPNSACQFNVSFDRSFICSDPLLNYTGLSPIKDSYISSKSSRMYFNDLYLTNYSAGFSVGELPIINTKFTSFSEKNEYDRISPFFNPFEIVNSSTDVPRLGSITISGEIARNLIMQNGQNGIFSFDYSLEIKRQPYYSIGTYSACVSTVMPIVINFSVNSKILNQDYSIDNWPKYKLNTLTFNKFYDFDISVVTQNTNTSFPIRNATLVSTEVQYASTNFPELKRTFIGYYGI